MYRRSLCAALGIALLAVAPASMAQSPSLMQKYVGEDALSASQADPCYKENMGAIAVTRSRDAGNSRQDLVNGLRAHGDTEANRPVEYSIVNDAYGFPSVKPETYWIYRTLICHAKLHGKPVPKSFSDVVQGVLACQEKYGGSDPLFDCIILAVFQAGK